MLETSSPEAAVDELERLYAEAVTALRAGLMRFAANGVAPSAEERKQFCYPFLRLIHGPDAPRPRVSRAFSKLDQAGEYVTTITQPRYFRAYLLEQLIPLVNDYNVRLVVGRSNVAIPFQYVADVDEMPSLAGLSPAQIASAFTTAQLSTISDDIVDAQIEIVAGRPRPLALFDATRVDFSLTRLTHYMGNSWTNTQPWIVLTNYHRYVVAFVEWAYDQILKGGEYDRLVAPGNIVIDRSTTSLREVTEAAAHQRFQMPGYHLMRPGGSGISLVNIGVGPSNAKTITDHLAVLRPHCWLMIGHCGGLRHSQQVGDFVLAHAYLRDDHILDDMVPLEIPIPAIAEVQVALQKAAAAVVESEGEEYRHRVRTGTVVTTGDRNWELRFKTQRKRFNQSRAIAIDMESATVATQGFRMRVPYGTFLCVSDKPLHGQPKLAVDAAKFYATAVKQHLHIALDALRTLSSDQITLHSRKLRSFDEPPFR